MHQLKDFTANITPFIEYQSLERFLSELDKVPNCQERFETLIKNDKIWLQHALSTSDENGVHIYFFYEEIKVAKDIEKPNQLFLRDFCLATRPTLKVEIYTH